MVSGVSSVGGLVGGLNSSTIENSYSAATVSSVRSFAGGLVGYTSSRSTIKKLLCNEYG